LNRKLVQSYQTIVNSDLKTLKPNPESGSGLFYNSKTILLVSEAIQTILLKEEKMKRPDIVFLIILSFFLLVNAQESATSILAKHKQQIYKNATFSPRSSELVTAQNQIDALYYEIHITIDYATPKLDGKVFAKFKVLVDSLQQVRLDLERTMTVDSVSAAAISAIHNQDMIELELDKPYSFGEEFILTIHYSGAPNTGGFGYFQFDQMPDGSPHVWTLSEPYGAKYWWPCKDTPADKADSADIFITIPEDQLAGSNGALFSVTNNGDGTKTFHWHEQYPIATYLVSLAIGNYDHFQEYYRYSDTDSMLLDYYVYPGELENARSAFADMHDYLDALSYYFGPYPFLKEKYGMAQYNRGGGMEHQTLTSIGPIGSEWTYLYVHELGHQWFGDAVTCASWTDIWLNEGFASYSEALYAEWAGYNNHPPGFEAYQDYMMSQYYIEGGTIFITDTSSVSNIFNKIVYDKGSWVLHMLRHILGDDVFFDVLKNYVSDMRWQYGSVSTANFKTICEEKSGLDLSPFFEQWLYHPYYPIYKYSWSSLFSGTTEYTVVLQLDQIQNTTLYQMPIDVWIGFQDGSDTTIVVQNDAWQQTYSLKFPKKPVDVQLDPQHWILREVNRDVRETYTALIKIENAYPNPFLDAIHIEITDWAVKIPNVKIFNLKGQRIKNLLAENRERPHYLYRWDGRNEQGFRVASGVYFINAQSTNGSNELRKIVYLK